ncbi:hypothetical protein LJC09_03180 [Desulfovibrio sp. OttesenSCG-928-F20]|nr:hypothetical protein [Desulfovibrio sp. OttesenSCG-928-F20]
MFISVNAQKLLKVLHLITASCWFGGCLALSILMHAAQYAQSDAELFGVLKSYKYLNVIITVYLGAYGTLFTGLAYSLCTNRGFIRHKWVIAKWVMTLGMIYGGAVYLGTWSTSLLEMSQTMGLAALENAEYLRAHTLTSWGQIICLVLFLLSFLLSVYKPWEQEEIRAQFAQQ